MGSIIWRDLRIIAASALFFSLGLPAGLLAYPLVEDQLPQLLMEAFGDVMSGTTAEMILKVFLRNLSASLIMLLLGMTVLLTLFSLFFNGFVVGLVARYSVERGLGIHRVVFGIIPHGVFELPAVFMSAALGMHVGLQLLTQSGRRVAATAQAIREAGAVYLTVVLPLLVAAALIEVLVSKNLIA